MVTGDLTAYGTESIAGALVSQSSCRGRQVSVRGYSLSRYKNDIIKDISDHTTFREHVQTLGWLDKVGCLLSLSYVIRSTLTSCIFQSVGISSNLSMNKDL